MLLAFFAGAISMLFFLTPGKIKLDDLLDDSKRAEMVDFDRAAARTEEARDIALFYAYKAKRYIENSSNKSL